MCSGQVCFTLDLIVNNKSGEWKDVCVLKQLQCDISLCVCGFFFSPKFPVNSHEPCELQRILSLSKICRFLMQTVKVYIK